MPFVHQLATNAVCTPVGNKFCTPVGNKCRLYTSWQQILNTIDDRQIEGGKGVYMMDIIELTGEKASLQYHILARKAPH